MATTTATSRRTHDTMWLALLVLGVGAWDGALGPWALENACVASLALAKCWVVARYARAAPSMLVFGASNVLLVEGSLAVQALLNATVYRRTPVFHDRPPDHAFGEVLKNALRATLPVHALTTLALSALCVQDALECALPQEYSVADDFAALTFAGVACKFVVFRLVSDAVFYATHRAQHHFPSLYSSLHAHHHRHRRTSLRTNFQFTALDLLLEGSLPSLVAGLVLLPCTSVSPLEMTLFLGYVQWYQIGSHSAKDVDSITAVPPLAPLLNASFARALRPAQLRAHRHVRFHAAHHRKVAGNYGISPWLDVLLGTAV